MSWQIKPLAHKSAVWLLRKLNPGDVRIRHHYTHDRVTLDAFKHKGYWFHGKRREQHSMQFFRELIAPGDTILEAGGHIGYVSMYFASICGPGGRVVVFEPAPDNLRYLRKNIAHLPQVTIVEKAVGSSTGRRDLFVEDLTGQNNSFYADYDIFKKNTVTAGYDAGGYHRLGVEVTTIDGYCMETGARPDFVKIDIEGAELEALQGMEQVAQNVRPVIMVEVSRNIPEVFGWLMARGYLLYSDQRERMREPSGHLFNVFFLHPAEHSQKLHDLNLDAA